MSYVTWKYNLLKVPLSQFWVLILKTVYLNYSSIVCYQLLWSKLFYKHITSLSLDLYKQNLQNLYCIFFQCCQSKEEICLHMWNEWAEIFFGFGCDFVMEKEYNNSYLMLHLSLSSGLYPPSAHILFKWRNPAPPPQGLSALKQPLLSTSKSHISHTS